MIEKSVSPEEILLHQGRQNSATKRMESLRNKIASAEIELRKTDPSYNKNYFTQKIVESAKSRETVSVKTRDIETVQTYKRNAVKNKKTNLTKEQIVNSNLSWDEKKKLFAKLHEEEKGNEIEKDGCDFER